MQKPDLTRVARRIEAWFRHHQRALPWRETYDPYMVWVSEIMLQQTRMEVMLDYYERFLERFPSIAALAASTDHDVMAAWSGLGYYRRARMLRAGAADVMSRFGGVVPSAVEELVTIPGIGRYTAGAIASVAHRRRAPIVDGNVARIVARLFGSDADAWPRAEALVKVCKSPRDFNQGLMEVGALICKPRNPSCLLCPVREDCVALATGRVDDLPRPKEKKETRAMRIALYVVSDRKGRVLMRRESGPLMTAMYHLPHGDTSLLAGKPLDVVRGARLGSVRHTITTRRIEFDVYAAKLAARSHDYTWIDPEKLAEVPHPSYVRKALALLGWGSGPEIGNRSAISDFRT